MQDIPILEPYCYYKWGDYGAMNHHMLNYR